MLSQWTCEDILQASIIENELCLMVIPINIIHLTQRYENIKLLFLNFILIKNSKFFRQIYCPSSGALILYSQQYVFVIQVMLTVC